MAQERGIETACAFVQYGSKQNALRTREAFVTALQEKGLWGATRAGTKKNALELCLLLTEAEDTGDGVLESGVLQGLKSKQPKAVAGAVTVMKELIKWASFAPGSLVLTVSFALQTIWYQSSQSPANPKVHIHYICAYRQGCASRGALT